MTKENLKQITMELDGVYGELNLQNNTLCNINTELGMIATKVNDTNESDITSLALTMRDINHKIELLADLMNYTMKDKEETMHQLEMIKESYYDFHVREDEKEPTA